MIDTSNDMWSPFRWQMPRGVLFIFYSSSVLIAMGESISQILCKTAPKSDKRVAMCQSRCRPRVSGFRFGPPLQVWRLILWKATQLWLPGILIIIPNSVLIDFTQICCHDFLQSTSLWNPQSVLFFLLLFFLKSKLSPPPSPISSKRERSL